MLLICSITMANKPQIERKEALKTLTDMLEPPVLYSDHVEADGNEMFAAG